jgi:hypothetical protein
MTAAEIKKKLAGELRGFLPRLECAGVEARAERQIETIEARS